MRKPDYQQYRRYYQFVSEVGNRPNTRLYMTVAFTFLTISLFAWYAIRPTLQTILYLRREIGDKQEINQKMEEKITALIEAQGTLSQIEPNLPLIAEALPEQPDVVGLLGQLASLAEISEASISSARTSDIPLTGEASRSAAQKPTDPAELSLTITITGTYEKLLSFLGGMIDMRRIIAVDSLNFSPDIASSGPAGNSSLQLVMKVRSFYMPEK